MDPKLLKYAQAAIPRYTSYPTAAQFHNGITQDHARRWQQDIGPTDTLSLYVHIPFCQKLCWYCGCHTSITGNQERIARYVDVLCSEINQTAANVSSHAGVRHIHFGGGTPNILTPELFKRVMKTLTDGFALGEGAEVAVELDPRHLTSEKLEALAESGVNRASMGVQDINHEVQTLINRIQPFDLVQQAVEGLRKHGITGLNADLIYGLPSQTQEHVVKSCEALIGIDIDRVSAFGYAHVPWFKKHQQQIREEQLPDGLERMLQAEAIRQTLSGNGYLPIGIDHFALESDPLAVATRDGRLRRNFQGYTDDAATVLIGFGASSIGTLPAGFVQNAPSQKAYIEAVEAGHSPVVRGYALNDDDRLRAEAIEIIMCGHSLDTEALCARHGVAPDSFVATLQDMDDLEEDGLVVRDGSLLHLTEWGQRFARTVAVRFDAHYAEGEKRHARAM